MSRAQQVTEYFLFWDFFFEKKYFLLRDRGADHWVGAKNIFTRSCIMGLVGYLVVQITCMRECMCGCHVHACKRVCVRHLHECVCVCVYHLLACVCVSVCHAHACVARACVDHLHAGMCVCVYVCTCVSSTYAYHLDACVCVRVSFTCMRAIKKIVQSKVTCL
jgi:hypothetical protein